MSTEDITPVYPMGLLTNNGEVSSFTLTFAFGYRRTGDCQLTEFFVILRRPQIESGKRGADLYGISIWLTCRSPRSALVRRQKSLLYRISALQLASMYFIKTSMYLFQ